MRTIVFNGKIISGDAIIPRGYIGIENGIIAEIGVGGPTHKSAIRPSAEGAHWIDAEGDYICPGFIDLHVHGVGICDLHNDTARGIKKMVKILASQGVTSFLPTLVTAPIEKIIETITAISASVSEGHGANILGINMEGPFLSAEKRGAHPLKDIKSPNLSELKRIIDAAQGKLKIMTIAPEMPGAMDLVNLLKQNGVIPAMGHTMATYEDTVSALEGGIYYICHVFNAMAPFHHRNPGPVPAILMRKDVSVEIIADGVHLHPAVIKLLYQIKQREKIILITDALAGIMRKGDKAEFAGVQVESNGTGAYSENNTLMGSVTPMNRAIQNMIQFTDSSLTSAIKLATINPANILGIGDKKGTIEIGKDADLVILGEDFSIKSTLIAGKLI
jgi:N-acetylglucosamine-6-phosphate deacetylase